MKRQLCLFIFLIHKKHQRYSFEQRNCILYSNKQTYRVHNGSRDKTFNVQDLSYSWVIYLPIVLLINYLQQKIRVRIKIRKTDTWSGDKEKHVALFYNSTNRSLTVSGTITPICAPNKHAQHHITMMLFMEIYHPYLT